MVRKLYLLFEFTVIFLVIPLVLALRILPAPPIPVLIAVAVLQTVWLWREGRFSAAKLINEEGVRRHWRVVAVRSLVLTTLLGAGVAVLAPKLLFAYLESAPVLWALLMILYPILSVVPQELVFRAFLFHRYADLFGKRQFMVAASAAAFGFAGNWVSLVMSAFGGVLFARTYQQSRSLLLVTVEHALFGNFIFTIGLGEYFRSTF